MNDMFSAGQMLHPYFLLQHCSGVKPPEQRCFGGFVFVVMKDQKKGLWRLSWPTVEVGCGP